MTELKTKQSDASIDTFLNSVADEKRRTDTEAVCAMISRVTGWQPKMWGASMIGFGAYNYVYESGRKGRWMITGVSPRKAALTVYIMCGFTPFPNLMARIGKYKTGKSCLYIKKLEDIDMAVLEEMVRGSVDVMKERYDWADE